MQVYFEIAIAIMFSVVLPLTLSSIILFKKYSKLKVILAGAAVFIIFQILTRIPLMQIVHTAFPQLFPTDATKITLHFVIYALIVSLSAGVFEEIGRYLGYKLLIKKYYSWSDGFAFGVGHGGIEAILLLGLPLLLNTSSIIMSASLNPYMTMLGGFERLSAITIQIGLSLLVLLAVKNRKLGFVILAIIIHMVIDFIPVMLLGRINTFILEGIIGVFAAISFVWIIKSRGIFNLKSEILDSNHVQSL